MKRIYILIALVTLGITARSQGISINTNGAGPSSNAELDISSPNKGVLFPRMSTTGRLALPAVKGLLVYDTTAGNFFYNTGATWLTMQTIIRPPFTWSTSGNSNVGRDNFLGLRDTLQFNLTVNGQNAGYIDFAFANTTLGYNTGFFGGASFSNIVVGAFAMNTNHNGDGANNSLGSHTLTAGGTANDAVGAFALANNRLGELNTALGYAALQHNTDQSNSVAAGAGALQNSSTGRSNTAMGYNALFNDTSGINNTVIGNNALFSNMTGSANTAAGYKVLYNATSGATVAVGDRALFNSVSVGESDAEGYLALFNFKSGTSNVAAGMSVMSSATSGNDNTALGFEAMLASVSPGQNVALGYEALFSVSSAFNNTGVGAFTNLSSGTFNNSVAIGADAIINASNKVRIGNTSVTVIEGQVPFTTPSDGRFKHRIREDVKGLDFILRLRPVTYLFDSQRFNAYLNDNIVRTAYTPNSPVRQTGFIAQEVEKAAGEAGYDFSGIIRPGAEHGHYSLSYQTFVVPLVKGMQEQQALIEAQQKKIAALKQYLASGDVSESELSQLEQQVAELRQLVKNLQSN